MFSAIFFFLCFSKAHTIQFPILFLVDVVSVNIRRCFSYPSSDGGRGNNHLDAKMQKKIKFLLKVCGRRHKGGVIRKRYLEFIRSKAITEHSVSKRQRLREMNNKGKGKYRPRKTAQQWVTSLKERSGRCWVSFRAQLYMFFF